MASDQETQRKQQQALLGCGKIKEAFFVALPLEDVVSVEALNTQLQIFVVQLIRFLPPIDLPPKIVPQDSTASDDLILDVLSCKACGKIFEDAVTLTCPVVSHTFCRSCVQTPTEWRSCPTCHHPCSPSVNGNQTKLSDVKASFTIKRLVEVFYPVQVEVGRMKAEGNRLFKSGEFFGAVAKYTAAIEKDGNNAALFSNRSQAFLMLKDVSRAVEDADRAVCLDPSWPKGHYRKATALSETSDVSGALDAVLRLMFLDRNIPQTEELLFGLLSRLVLSSASNAPRGDGPRGDGPRGDGPRGDGPRGDGPRGTKSAKIVGKRTDTAVSRDCVADVFDELENLVEKCRSSLHVELIKRGTLSQPPVHADVKSEKVEEILTCTLCYRILYDAVTPNCGHSFCKPCLHRVLDFKPSCPECRQDLSVFLATRLFGSSDVIQKCEMFLLPKLYEERVTDHATEIQSLSAVSEDVLEVAIFVLSTAWPGKILDLHVFEPRYRLMMRQARESGSNLFGMCEYTHSRAGDSFSDFGTMLKITQIHYTEDGRCLVCTVGQRRFKVLSRGMRDGYHTAKVKYIQDAPIPPNRLPVVTALQDEVYHRVEVWVSNPSSRLRRVLQHHEALPPKADLTVYTVDGPTWIWWLAGVAGSVGVQTGDLLPDTDVESRIRYFDGFVSSELILSRITGLRDLP